MKKLLLPALSLCLLLFACQTKESKPTLSPPQSSPPASPLPSPLASQVPASPSPSPTAAETPTPRPSGEIIAPDFEIDEDFWQQEYRHTDGALLASVSCAWPKLPDSAPQAIRDYYSQLHSDTEREAAAVFSKEAAISYEDSKASSQDFRPYSLEENYSVQFNDSKILSVLRNTARYTGGVHGQEDVFTETFDLSTGKKLTLDDLMSVDRETYIRRLVPLICEQIASNPEDYVEGYEQTAADSFPVDLFCVTDTGLALFYPPYVLASYAQGVCRFDIPLEKYEDIWKY